MKNATKKINEMLKGMAQTMIEGDSREWPPTCSILIYQPMRPEAREITEQAEESK